MNKSERQEKIDAIVNDCDGGWDYRDFVSDCVRQVVSKWTYEEINNWFGIEPDDENKIKCCNCRWVGTESNLVQFDDTEGGGYGCPNCKTDHYLSDVID